MNANTAVDKLIQLLSSKSIPVSINQADTYDLLLEKIGDARFVLMGEATHGTEEFYKARIQISQRLIKEKGFIAIAIEGDWPDSYHVNRYLKGRGDKEDVARALEGFSRFPRWMWRNTTLPPFLKWLRDFNDKIPTMNNKVGFYGLDLYSLHASMHEVIEYLKKVDPQAAARAIKRYACFEQLSLDPQKYGYMVSAGIKEPCVHKAVAQMLEMQQNTLTYMKEDGFSEEDAHFYATQNARIVKNAEKYYRTHFEGQISSWNIRDSHMADTLNILANYLENTQHKPAKIIVWAHNSHVGDARATEMGQEGEINIGQLIREQYPKDTYTIGFSTYQGTVTAALEWDEEAQFQSIKPGLMGSYEALFHEVEYPNFLLFLSNDPELDHYLQLPRLQRAIGVIYRSDTERASHYFLTKLPEQFDAIIHFDQTTAVKPLDDPIKPEALH